MVSEIAIGRKTQKNAVGAFTALGYSNWRIIGILGILSGVLILSFYNVVAGWALGFFIELMQGHFDIGGRFGSFVSDWGTITIYSLIFMVMTALIISNGVSSGIERASKILMPTLLIMILGLVAYSLTLENAMKGVSFYLVPDFSKVTLVTVYNALGQAFFSLSLGMGALITYGSYLNKKDNIISSATFITLADVGIAFIAGLLMFPLVSYMNGGDFSNVEGGAGLIFTVLPGVFESLGGTFGVIVGAGFFLLLSFAALTSTVSLLEVPVSYVIDEYHMSRKKSVVIMSIIIYIIGIPSLLSNGASEYFTSFVTYIGADSATSFMDLVGHISSDTFLPLGGMLIVFFVAYVWKKENLSEELSHGNPTFVGSIIEKLIHFGVQYVSPVILAIIFVLTVADRFFGYNPFK